LSQREAILPAVLVVEDEPLIRMEAVDMIEDAGFRVYAAGSAAAALAVFAQHDDIGILFTDVDMPGSMNGLSLAFSVRDRWPLVGIVIASGILEIKNADVPEGAALFPKPYPTARIGQCLQDVVVSRLK
jgi:CheY-like chemotaxis protein